MKSRKESTNVVKARSKYVTICSMGLRCDSVIVILFDAELLESPVVDDIVKNR